MVVRNAESAFRDAFNQPDPAPKLLEFVTAHPDVEAIADLILVYTELVGESPTQFDKFAAALVRLQRSKGTTVAGLDRFGNRAQLEIAYALSEQLHDHHAGSLVGPSNPSVTPYVIYLKSTVKCMFLEHAFNSTGSYLYGPTGTEVGSDDVLAILEKVKESHVVKDPDGRRLLEATIQQANVVDAWSVLFP